MHNSTQLDPDAEEVYTNLIKWMKHNINVTDPDFLETYEKVTDLLQSFINRQCQLREINKRNSSLEIRAEQQINSDIIHFIQWVRYHFWGNDDQTIVNKTGITSWTFRDSPWGTNARYSICTSFAKSALGVDPSVEHISACEIVEAILNVITPKHSHSIFAVDDQITESMKLKLELDRIKRKIHPNDSADN